MGNGDAQIVIALAAVIGPVSVAIVTFTLNDKAKRDRAWKERKLNHYRTLISAMSDLAIHGGDNEHANEAFFVAFNTIALIASQEVINALMRYQDSVIKHRKSQASASEVDTLMEKVLLAIRKDIGLSKKDDPLAFKFSFISNPKR